MKFYRSTGDILTKYSMINKMVSPKSVWVWMNDLCVATITIRSIKLAKMWYSNILLVMVILICNWFN